VQTAIDARMNFLASALNDMASSRAASLSMRLNFVVFVLTIVSITSTVGRHRAARPHGRARAFAACSSAAEED